MIDQDRSLALAIVPIVALATIVVIQICLGRLRPEKLPWWSLALGSLLGILFAAACTVFLLSDTPAELLAYLIVNVAATAALAFCYFNFVNLNFTSLRIRLLREMLPYTEGFTIADLTGAYDADMVLELRLRRLVEADELKFDGFGYRLGRSRKVVRLAIVLAAFRKLLKL